MPLDYIDPLGAMKIKDPPPPPDCLFCHGTGVQNEHRHDNPPVPCPRKYALTECRAASTVSEVTK